jgi:hypothetical protein
VEYGALSTPRCEVGRRYAADCEREIEWEGFPERSASAVEVGVPDSAGSATVATIATTMNAAKLIASRGEAMLLRFVRKTSPSFFDLVT